MSDRAEDLDVVPLGSSRAIVLDTRRNQLVPRVFTKDGNFSGSDRARHFIQFARLEESTWMPNIAELELLLKAFDAKGLPKECLNRECDLVAWTEPGTLPFCSDACREVAGAA